MKIMIVTDAWEPQVNGVVRTLKSTSRELIALGHRVELLTPLEFRTIACPTYPEIRLSLLPRRRVAQRIEEFAPDALHIATEGPLGMAARSFALRNKLPLRPRITRAFLNTCRHGFTFRSLQPTSFCTGSTSLRKRSWRPHRL